MANLETLELTINANAESASEGLKNLINSLSALSKKVGSSVGGLKRLNAELATLKGFKGVSFPGSSSKTLGNVEKTTKELRNNRKHLKTLKIMIGGTTEQLIRQEIHLAKRNTMKISRGQEKSIMPR